MLRLGLGLGLNRRGSAPSNPPPTDIAWAGAHTVVENSALGTVVGGALSATDPDDVVTFSLVDDAGGMFGIGADGTSIIVTGVPDYETATSHNITVRATDSDGGFYDEVFAITVTDVAETEGDDPLPDDGTIIVDDEDNFDEPPIIVVIDDGVTFPGKKKAGVQGKFIYDIGQAAAGTVYTMRYDPDWSLLTNGGVTAMVAFGLRDGNSFRLSGLKGDGAAGLKAYELHGSGGSGWSQGTGHTATDGGAAAHGTQGGPNWLQFEVSADGTTYTMRTSSDGDSWTDEFTGVTPTPHADVDGVPTFGIAVLLEAADAGSFRVDVTLWTADAPLTYALTDDATDATSTSTYTAPGLSLGALPDAGKKRVVVATVAWCDSTGAGTSEVTAVSIGGIAATRAYRQAPDNAILDNAEAWFAEVPTGLTGDVVITNTGANINRRTVSLYSFYGEDPRLAAASGGTTTTSVEVAVGDIVVGVGVRSNSGTHTLSNLTADFAVSAGGTHYGFHGSHVVSAAGTFSTTISDTNNSPRVILVSFRDGIGAGLPWRAAHSVTLSGGDSGGWNNFTDRVLIPAIFNLTSAGDRTRVTIDAGAAEGLIVTNCYIGEKAAAGDAYDYAAAPTQITFDGGSAGFTIAAGAQKVSDAIAFTLDPTKDYLIGIYCNGGTGADTTKALTSIGLAHYSKAGSDANTVNATGYSATANQTRFVSKVETRYAA